MPSVKTSIIIVTYNCGDVIEDNLVSSLGQEDAEIILIDNASSDDTVMRISKYLSNILVIQNSENLGFTKACNQGIKQARGKYIMFLNPDASLHTGSLKILSEILDLNSEIGAVAPNLYYPNGDFQNYTRRFPTAIGLFIESFIPKRFWNSFRAYRNYTYHDLDFTMQVKVEQPAGAALLFRNQFLLDESFFIYWSDVDLCRQIIDRGYQIIQTPNAKAIHHQSKGGTEVNKLRVYLDADFYYGARFYFKKYNHKSRHVFYCVIFFFGLISSATISIIKGGFCNKIYKIRLFLTNSNFTSIYR